MSVRVSAEEMETTRSERVLAVVLAAFMAVSFIWVYAKLDDIGSPEYVPVSRDAVFSPAQERALARNAKARSLLSDARGALATARNRLEPKREAFRTALEAGQPTLALEADYRAAQARYDQATQSVPDAQSRVSSTQPAADAARQRLTDAEQKASDDFEAKQDSHERQTFILRLIWVLALLGVGYRLLGRLRAERSRYLPVGLAWIGAAAVTALVMAGDYFGGYIALPADLGPLAISLAGTALTLAAFVALQRYLQRRVPLRRVRKGHCPFCGFPVGSGEHCEGCGRAIQAPCSACRAPRRVGTQHCAACGAGGG